MTNQSAKEQATTGRFRKKPVIVEAVQWFKLGQHPAVLAAPLQPIDGYIVGTHGWIQTLEGGHIVSPGDWIITGIQGEHYPCKPDIFEATYEPVTQAARASSPVAPNHASSLLPLWNDAYTAFKGAFDSPMMRRKIDDEFSADARKRLRDFDEALRASPVAIHEGWQPIETVPKDSKSRLVYCPDRGNTYLVFWDKVVGEWRHVGGGGVLNQWDYPTHWMPLPQDPGASAPPSPGAAQGI